MLTLAEKLGIATPVSTLLKKANGLGLGLEQLQTLAVQRGCIHYSTGNEPSIALASEEQFSNEELAIALLSVALPYDPCSIRCGAAILGAKDNVVGMIARLAIEERSAVPVRYVAEAGRKYEPANPFWTELLAALPECPPPKSGVLPHPTRFVSMTGFTRHGPGLVVEWQRPHTRQLAAA